MMQESGIGENHVTNGSPDDEARGTAAAGRTAQANIALLRQNVLSGRGPGASRSEFLRHTRGRTFVGGRPVATEREAVARAAAAARRDDDVLLHVLAARPPRGNGYEAYRGAPRAMEPVGASRRPRGLRFPLAAIAALLAARAVWRRIR